MSKINTDRIGTRDGTLDIDVKSIMVRDDSMENLGDYEQGLELTQQHQFIWKDESKYTVKLGHAPFVLTGVWEFDSEKLEIYGAWDHSALTNRDKENSHSAGAITYVHGSDFPYNSLGKELQTLKNNSSDYQIVDSFEKGATITERNQALRVEADGRLYRWAGDLPKVVVAGSAPENTGGVQNGSWLEVSELTLRYELQSGGGTIVGVASGKTLDVTLVHKLDTISNLRDLGAPLESVWLSGYHTSGDGAFGSNFFVWDKASIEPDNGGTIIQIRGASVGRYILQYQGPASVKFFGVVGDGTTDDTAALQAALDSCEEVHSDPTLDILVSRSYDDGSDAQSQNNSYAIKIRQNTTLDLRGGTLSKNPIGEGDNIANYHAILCLGPRFKLLNGVVDMRGSNSRFLNISNSVTGSLVKEVDFINLTNSGLPRTYIGSSIELIVIFNTSDAEVADCNFYVGHSGDKSGDTVASIDNPSFGLRITTSFRFKEEEQTGSTHNSRVVRCNFYGPFTWQPIEIAGTGTKNCYMKDIYMYRPILTAIDLDKGCKSCYAQDITIVQPRGGIRGLTGGGDGFAVIRIQGNNDGTNYVFAEDCHVDNVDIYDLPKEADYTVPELMGALIAYSSSKRSVVTNVRTHGEGAFYNLGCSSPKDHENKATNISASVLNVCKSQSGVPFEVRLENCTIKARNVAIISSAYLRVGQSFTFNNCSFEGHPPSSGDTKAITGWYDESAQPVIHINNCVFKNYGKFLHMNSSYPPYKYINMRLVNVIVENSVEAADFTRVPENQLHNTIEFLA